jgi:NhaP-type Na+/H+ or K+/H+ antiporter
MAEAQDYHRGEMDIAEQASTFHSFIMLSKWGSLVIASVLTFFIVWLCAHASFIASFVVGVLIAAVGYFVLREGKSAGH